MNTYHNLLFLTDFLKKQLLQAQFQKAYSVYKNQIDLVFLCSNNEAIRLVISTNPSATCLFLIDDKPIRQNNITYFFEQLHYAKISHIETIKNERVVTIAFENGFQLVAKLYGNKPNVFLFNAESDLPVDTFKKEKDTVSIEELTKPKEAKFRNLQLIGDLDSVPPKELLVGCIPTLNRKYLKSLVEHFGHLNDFPSLVTEIKLSLEKGSSFFNVLNDGSITTISPKLLPDFEVIKAFEEINDAIKWSFLHQTSTKNFNNQKEQLEKLLRLSIRKKENTLLQLESPEITNERADTYENFAHSLMAYGSTINWSSLDKDEVVLPCTLNETSKLVIKIDPKLSAIQNAEKYYAKARYNRSRIKDYEALAVKLEDEITNLDKKLSEISTLKSLQGLKEWQKKHKSLLNTIQNSSKQELIDLPYRVIRLDGMEVWVGKNAKSNDELVRNAHKEDIWFHARGVPGSHVLIRMNNQKDFPSKIIIESVAQLAAHYSKLRGSALVPVSYAKKKFVRKPKNAVPGLVVMDKEETILVEPKQQLSW
jgi:predicted ribosome quality control (RQC) complex YloA/Tae2 family protein